MIKIIEITNDIRHFCVIFKQQKNLFMKHLYTTITLIILSLFVGQDVYGQFKLSGEVRPRPEMFDNGYKTLANENSKANWVTSQRTRINADYTMDYMKFKVTFQDIRNWGETKTLTENGQYLALHEAWGEIMFNEKFSLKLGRQELVYDDHRIFGSVAWAQQARSHDLGLFKYEDEFKLHVGLSFNKYKEGGAVNAAGFNRAMQYAWFNKSFEKLQLSVLALNHGTQVVEAGDLIRETNYSQTIGTHLKSKLGAVSLNGSFYYQMGKDNVSKSIGAYNAALNASMGVTESISVLAGLELLSGSESKRNNAGGVSATSTTDNNSFNPFYGTNHKFNGFMDYFYVGNHGNLSGLNDFNVGAKWKSGKWNAGLTGHYFMSNANLIDQNDVVQDAGLGTELDLNAGYKFNNWIAFSGGYSQMFATESMEVLKGGSKDVTNNWAYIMITIKPELFNSSK